MVRQPESAQASGPAITHSPLPAATGPAKPGLISARWSNRGKKPLIVVMFPRRTYRPRAHLDQLSAGEAEALIRALTERLAETAGAE